MLKISFRINLKMYLVKLVAILLAYFWEVYLLSEMNCYLPAFTNQCEWESSFTTSFEIALCIHRYIGLHFTHEFVFILPVCRSNSVKISAWLRLTLSPVNGRISRELSMAMNLLKYTVNPEQIHHWHSDELVTPGKVAEPTQTYTYPVSDWISKLSC